MVRDDELAQAQHDFTGEVRLLPHRVEFILQLAGSVPVHPEGGPQIGLVSVDERIGGFFDILAAAHRPRLRVVETPSRHAPRYAARTVVPCWCRADESATDLERLADGPDR